MTLGYFTLKVLLFYPPYAIEMRLHGRGSHVVILTAAMADLLGLWEVARVEVAKTPLETKRSFRDVLVTFDEKPDIFSEPEQMEGDARSKRKVTKTRPFPAWGKQADLAHRVINYSID